MLAWSTWLPDTREPPRRAANASRSGSDVAECILLAEYTLFNGIVRRRRRCIVQKMSSYGARCALAWIDHGGICPSGADRADSVGDVCTICVDELSRVTGRPVGAAPRIVTGGISSIGTV